MVSISPTNVDSQNLKKEEPLRHSTVKLRDRNDYLRMKLDFPTPLSPIRIILNMWSYVTVLLSARAERVNERCGGLKGLMKGDGRINER